MSESEEIGMDEVLLAVPRERIRPSRFFRRLDWSAFWTACILSFVVYVYTLAPTVSLEDSGELAVAGDCLGVPHPPGYPIWSILSWFAARVFSFVTFRGQPNPAWSIGLTSAVFGALASGMTAMLVCRSGSDLLRESRDTLHKASHKTEDQICWVGGVVCSLLFAFTPVMWSQAVIVEVYALNAFFLALILLLSYWWMCRPSDRLLYVTGFVFGLGLTNYQVLLLAALPLVIIIMLKDVELFRDFVIAGAPIGALLVLNGGALKSITHPLEASCAVYLSINFGVLILAYFFLPRGKTVALTILYAELGVAFYAYMPLVSDLRKPLPMNWGYPRTWEGFKHAITRGQYEKIKPANVFSRDFVRQIGEYFADLRVQFTMLTFPLGFLPFTVWQTKGKKRNYVALYLAIALSLLAIILALFGKFVLNSPAALTRTYKALLLGVIALLGTGVMAIFVSQARELFYRFVGRTQSTISEKIVIGFVFLGAIGAYLFYAMMVASAIMDITEPLRRATEPLPAGAGKAILLNSAGLVVLIVLPILLAALIAWLMQSRLRLHVTMDHNSQQWIISTMFAFLAMSIILIALANPKGDIQDAFIQKVKFISSHALYALWIGYGLIFSLAFFDTLFRGNAILRKLALGTALVAIPALPLIQNGFDPELIRIYGGAEQTGHDFGWQFGNYQLRGADAISEELERDEEPLPNPEYPGEMGPDAIFYGGTDPGRFVPTYMIYGAKVREDVYLITQNALADNTYMSVMRDLYGDNIWIPAQHDSAKAFQRYVEEVKAGKRPKNADLKIEGGRVQVSGALGVMEINGILAQMIHEHNRYKHDFYVEESYVIRWMYPYLEPHGLIMKINADPINLAKKTNVIRDDMDLWDWYTRRLTGDSAFVRDIVARKSFSKLRSAIAGLYANRHRFKEAENAFQEARMLYPLSPEANFRLAQEVLMSHRKFPQAREIIADFGRQDPGNKRVPQFLKQIIALQTTYANIDKLEAKRRKDPAKFSINDVLALAEGYLKAGQVHIFRSIAQNVIKVKTLSTGIYYKLGILCQQAKQNKEMVEALVLAAEKLPANAKPEILLDITSRLSSVQRADKMAEVMALYVKRRPSDWKAWVDLALVQLALRKQAEALKSTQQAIRYGGNAAMTLMRDDKRLAPLLKHAAPRPQNLDRLMGLPGAKRGGSPLIPGPRRRP
jgi:tetratricopeptide (TPR) repeat protein